MEEYRLLLVKEVHLFDLCCANFLLISTIAICLFSTFHQSEEVLNGNNCMANLLLVLFGCALQQHLEH